ncbi:hypothetical protein HZB01_00965 [Candidatus Woesearchaeota archaeon]|nr:hypothetical protein [Candidatus Woesearchaeota archaeon]
MATTLSQNPTELADGLIQFMRTTLERSLDAEQYTPYAAALRTRYTLSGTATQDEFYRRAAEVGVIWHWLEANRAEKWAGLSQGDAALDKLKEEYKGIKEDVDKRFVGKNGFSDLYRQLVSPTNIDALASMYFYYLTGNTGSARLPRDYQQLLKPLTYFELIIPLGETLAESLRPSYSPLSAGTKKTAYDRFLRLVPYFIDQEVRRTLTRFTYAAAENIYGFSEIVNTPEGPEKKILVSFSRKQVNSLSAIVKQYLQELDKDNPRHQLTHVRCLAEGLFERYTRSEHTSPEQAVLTELTPPSDTNLFPFISLAPINYLGGWLGGIMRWAMENQVKLRNQDTGEVVTLEQDQPPATEPEISGVAPTQLLSARANDLIHNQYQVFSELTTLHLTDPFFALFQPHDSAVRDYSDPNNLNLQDLFGFDPTRGD